MPVLFIILMMGCIGGDAGFIMGNYQMMDLKQFWVKPGICLGAAFVFLILAIFKYGFNKKKRQKKLDALKEIKLVMDKLDAAKHERVYVERQLNNKKEALKDTQEFIKAEEEKSVDMQDYSDELKVGNVKSSRQFQSLSGVLNRSRKRTLSFRRRLMNLRSDLTRLRKQKLKYRLLRTPRVILKI